MNSLKIGSQHYRIFNQTKDNAKKANCPICLAKIRANSFTLLRMKLTTHMTVKHHWKHLESNRQWVQQLA